MLLLLLLLLLKYGSGENEENRFYILEKFLVAILSLHVHISSIVISKG